MAEPEAPKHETTLDTGKQQVGEVYAASLLKAADEAGETSAVLAEFQSLVEDVLNVNAQIEAILGSPRIAHEDKVSIIDKAFQGKVTKTFLNFLKVASKHGRLDCLRVTYASFREQLFAQQGQLEVQVTTATELDQATQDSMKSALSAAFDATAELVLNVDPELIGGSLIRVGDTVYDSSVANRLERVRESAKNNTIREIRLATERFSAGG
ncbi:MAG: ATP synthase F1 subunit delta [Planctomycetaceae bacterium]|nr:ATP synthase F1 subunit delta [Planctomycetaceae bacterium]|tara:strand:- start:1311 stop:1943 length:633 start_codon:yes stop_codon:yes gene_type:complete